MPRRRAGGLSCPELLHDRAAGQVPMGVRTPLENQVLSFRRAQSARGDQPAQHDGAAAGSTGLAVHVDTPSLADLLLHEGHTALDTLQASAT